MNESKIKVGADELNTLFLNSRSNTELMRKLKDFDEWQVKTFYFKVMAQIRSAVLEGDIDLLKSRSKLLDCVSNDMTQETLQFFCSDNEYPFKDTNIVILACKHNKSKILEQIFSINSKVSSVLGVNNTILPNHIDSEQHGAFYYAIRSNDTALLETLIEKWPGNYFVSNSEVLECQLSRAYKELKLRNVKLTDEMELFVETKLINLRLFAESSEQIQNKPAMSIIKERIGLVVEKITLLSFEYLNTRVDERFLLIAKFIAQNLFILKQQLKSTYHKLPWEEIEFCLVAFISSHISPQEINLIYNLVLSKEKILKHLINFSKCLNSNVINLNNVNINELAELRRNTRQAVIAQIVKSYPVFEELYADYKFIRDLYSLEKIKSYVDLALSANSKQKEGQLIITRSLQVIGEYLKNTLESPNLSSTTSELLLFSLPINTREIVTDLRNSLSHANALPKRTEIEGAANDVFFTNVQNDINKVSVVIVDILFKKKVKVLKNQLQRIIDSENVIEIREVAELFRFVKIEEMLSGSRMIGELKQIENLIKEVKNKISDKTHLEEQLFNLISKKLALEKKKSDITENDYTKGFAILRSLVEIMNMYDKISPNNVRGIKFLASNVLDSLSPNLVTHNLKDIVELVIQVFFCVAPRMSNEIVPLIFKIFQIVDYDMSNVKWIEELRDTLSQTKSDKSLEPKPENKQDDLLDLKITALKSVLNDRDLNNKLFEKFTSYKTNKKLQAAVEMLVLDIMSILGSSKKYLTDNLLFLDDDSPLLIGKNLRNHLAHGNAVIDILSFDSSISVVVNATKLSSGNVIKSGKRIGKLIKNEPSKLKGKLDQDLIIISNQDQMFTALAESDFEKLKSCLNNGADIYARTSNLQTALHCAAKGTDMDVLKFVLDQIPNCNLTDNNGQSPLHIAAAYGRKSAVAFFIEVKKIPVDVVDNNSKTPLHIAAEKGHKDVVEVLLRNKASTIAKSCAYSPVHFAIHNGHTEVAILLLKEESHVDKNEAKGGFTPLHVAADQGQLDVVYYLLKNDANVDAVNDRRVTPLHLAVLNGFFKIAEALISKGTNINATTIEGGTPLLYAVEHGDKMIVKILLENGANVNAIDKIFNYVPLNNAAKDGHLEIAELLLKYKADVSIATVLGMTPLLFAAQSGHSDIVNLLLKNNASAQVKEINGLNALHLSAMKGHGECVRALLREGVCIDVKASNNQVPLHLAAINGKAEVVEILSTAGANMNARDFDGLSPLHLSLQNGHIDVMRILINNGAKVNVRDKNDITPLHVAIQKGDREVVKTLIQEGADIHAVDICKNTTLHFAAENGNLKVIEDLCKLKISVHRKNKSGYTPLHSAVESNHIEIVKFFIAKGSNVDSEDNRGLTALCLAVRNNYGNIVSLLISKGADVNAAEGMALSTAVSSGYKNTVDSLLQSDNIKINKSDKDKIASLHLAAMLGHKNILEALLVKGAKPDVKTVDDVTPLLLSAARGHYECVKVLLTRTSDINVRNNEGIVPLHAAATEGFDEIVKLLLNNGADVNIRDYENRSSIETAVAKGHIKVVEILLQWKGININSNSYGDWTLLHIAAQCGNVEIIKKLVDRGADISAYNISGCKPVHVAAKNGHKKAVEFFLNSCNVSINDLCTNGLTLLHYAAHENQIDVVIYLIEKGININASANDGSKPIHIAAQHNNKSVLKVLLNSGAYYNAVNVTNKTAIDLTKSQAIVNILKSTDSLFKAVSKNEPSDVEFSIKDGAFLNAKNRDNVTPLHLAVWKGYEKVVDTLLENNADPNVMGKGGSTPLHYASKFSHFGIVIALLSKGAIYNAISEGHKAPIDFATNQNIVNLLNLVNDLFRNVLSGNSKVIRDLKRINDINRVKAVMNAHNKDNKTLMTLAISSGFPKIDELKKVMEDDISEVQVTIAKLLVAQEKYQEALDIYKNIYEIRKNILGADSPSTLDIQEEIAKMLYKQQNYPEALKIFKDVCQKRQDVLGQNSIEALNTRSIMALVMHRQGKNEEAISILNQVYQKQKEILGTKHLNVMTTEGHMAAVLDKQGRYEEALEFNYKALKSSKEQFGESGPSTLSIQNNIAMIFDNQKNHAEALKMYKQVFETRKKVLGPGHSDTLRAHHNMLGTLARLNRVDEALKGFQEVLETQKAVLGPSHFDTVNTQFNIGNLMLEQGKYLGAYRVFKEGIELRKKFLGSNHPDVLRTMQVMKAIEDGMKLEGDQGMGLLYQIEKDIKTAACEGDAKVVQNLIERGVDVNSKDEEGRTLMHFAVNIGQKDIVIMLLKNGLDAFQVTNKGNTPLHLAAARGYSDVIEILIQHIKKENTVKANDFLNAKTTAAGTVALHVAMNIESVKTLLKYGAIYDVKNNAGKSPLDLSKDQIITSLLKTINELFLQARKGDMKLISNLKNLKLDDVLPVINARNGEENTLLQVIIINKHKAMAIEMSNFLKTVKIS